MALTLPAALLTRPSTMLRKKKMVLTLPAALLTQPFTMLRRKKFVLTLSAAMLTLPVYGAHPVGESVAAQR